MPDCEAELNRAFGVGSGSLVYVPSGEADVGYYQFYIDTSVDSKLPASPEAVSAIPYFMKAFSSSLPPSFSRKQIETQDTTPSAPEYFKGGNGNPLSSGPRVTYNTANDWWYMFRNSFRPISIDFTWASAGTVTVTDPRSIKKPGGNGWNAGASSTQSFGLTEPEDGYAVWTTAENTTHKMAGLGNGDYSQSFTDIDYAIYMIHGGGLRIYEDGVEKCDLGAAVPSPTYVAGDVFRVEIVAGEVIYWKNNLELCRRPTTPTYPLALDTSLYSKNATINSAEIGTPNNGYFHRSVAEDGDKFNAQSGGVCNDFALCNLITTGPRPAVTITGFQTNQNGTSTPGTGGEWWYYVGSSLFCQDNGCGFAEIHDALFAPPVSVTCSANNCAALTDFKDLYGSDQVCGERDAPSLGGCSIKTYASAKSFCEAAGARLCTEAELQADETRATGCGHDFKKNWTQTPCPGGHIIEWGAAYSGNSTTCASDTSTHEVSCCGDVDITTNSTTCEP